MVEVINALTKRYNKKYLPGWLFLAGCYRIDVVQVRHAVCLRASHPVNNWLWAQDHGSVQMVDDQLIVFYFTESGWTGGTFQVLSIIQAEACP